MFSSSRSFYRRDESLNQSRVRVRRLGAGLVIISVSMADPVEKTPCSGLLASIADDTYSVRCFDANSNLGVEDVQHVEDGKHMR